MQRFYKAIAALVPNFCSGLAASLFIITVTIVAGAQGPKTAQEIMDFADSKMAAYKSWSADYSQSMNVLGSQVAMSGQVVQKSPHGVWMQLDVPVMGQHSQITMVMNQDGIVWQVVQIGSQRQIMKMDVNKIGSNALAQAGVTGNPLDQFDPRKQLETTRAMCNFNLVKGKEFDSEPMYVLDGTWKQAAFTDRHMAMAAAMVGKTRLFIGQTDGFIHRMEQYDKSQTNLVVAMELKNLKFNQDVPDSTFVYHPPADARVVDITPMVGAQTQPQEGAAGAAPRETPPSPPSPTGPAPAAK